MAHKAPGKHFRSGLSLPEVFRLFPDDKAAEQWLVEQRWPNGVCCHYCGSMNVQTGAQHKTMPMRCREKECAKRFSVRTGTVMQSSKLGYQVWVIAMYLLSTNLKSVSSMKLHRDLDITQKSAWHLAHRIRQAAMVQPKQFEGPVEVDETYMGGKRKNMHNAQRKELTGRGAKGKVAVAGIKDRDSNQVRAKVIERADAETLQSFVADTVDPNATVYTDEARAYNNLPFNHATVKHSVAEYVNGQAHTNGIESFWAILKRAHNGTFHKMSAKHLPRYVAEFQDKHNVRQFDTLAQMQLLARGMVNQRLKYQDLIS
ncbi:IS1595 family transposase [Candidatus Rariloculus sp.]|uniref:IS1595 family transposase n=1 Tax=Candidatus Rariloculus sp. TaxID=3101265 RepID=UPI003D0D92E8